MCFTSNAWYFCNSYRPIFQEYMKKIELELRAVAASMAQSQNFTVLLREKSGNRQLQILIGQFEAQAISVIMESLTPSRPLTHDIFRTALTSYDVTITEVVINNLIEGVFHAIIYLNRDGEKYEIDSRSSDAIAMAVRFGCPIYTYDFILKTAGVEFAPDSLIEISIDVDEFDMANLDIDNLKNFSTNELKNRLDEVLAAEDYEAAAKIRDELKNRKAL
jgi:uncharacterized protein